jgi:hypothetical protein
MSVTSTSSATESESRLANSNPANPAPSITTCFFKSDDLIFLRDVSEPLTQRLRQIGSSPIDDAYRLSLTPRQRTGVQHFGADTYAEVHAEHSLDGVA